MALLQMIVCLCYSKNSFVYKMSIDGKRVTLQEVGESFDLIYDGKFFQEVWEHEKRKNTFNWNNRSSKHDAY